MVLNQNLVYIGDYEPRRNIMQAGVPKRDLASIRAEYEELKKEVETQFLQLEQANNNLRQAGLQKPSDQHVFETFQAFSTNEDAPYDLPQRRNIIQTGIRQAAIRQPPSGFEMLETFMEFGGL